MTFLATKFLCRHGSKFISRMSTGVIRMSSGGPCDQCPPPPCPTQSAKPDPPVPSAPELPPCPKLPPPCPPPLCAQIPDPANPCNYCPPPCIDPEAPDLRALKQNQCKFQQDNGLPIFLKGGNIDVILYQGTLVLMIVSLCYNIYCIARI